MIYRIQKKEWDAIKRARKLGNKKIALLFKGANGWYYKCDDVSFAGVKAVLEYKKEIESRLHEQSSLI
jgi:hypothetical protein